MTDKLKTLEDYPKYSEGMQLGYDLDCEVIQIGDLRAEAIKHIIQLNEGKADLNGFTPFMGARFDGAIGWIQNFFNISNGEIIAETSAQREEDLK